MSATPLVARDWLVSAALAAVVLAAGSCRMAPGVCGAFHDDAIYVSTAEALATGEGYRLIDVPGQPLQTKYPILYPAMLAAVWRLWPDFPANLLAMQAVTLVFGAASVAAAYLYLVRFNYFSRGVAAGAGLICATGSYFLYFAVQTMAEMPFALFSLLALWGLETFLLRPEMTRRWQLTGGVLLALPFLCRTIGVTLIVAGLVVLLLHRRPLRWYAAGAACAALPWIAWSLLGRGIWDQDRVEGYYTDYFGCWSSTGLELAGRVVRSNALMIAHGNAALSLEGISSVLELAVGREAACMLLSLVGIAPLLALIPDLRRSRALPWMLVMYLTATLLWSWPPYRFLVPILAFVAAYLLSGWGIVLAKPCPQAHARQWAGAIVIGAIVLANCGLLACHSLQVRQSRYPLALIRDSHVAWSAYERTFAWLKQNSRPDDVLACGMDSLVALYTDRRAFRPFVYDPGRLFYGPGQATLITPEELAGILKSGRPRYLVHAPMPGFAEDKPLAGAINELRATHPDWLVVGYQDVDPRFIVFELDAKHEPALQPGDAPHFRQLADTDD